MQLFTNIQKNSLYFKIIGISFLFYSMQTILAAFIIYQIANNQTHTYLETITNRVKEDISFSQGKWDMQRYNSDPDVQGDYPLYILGTDGFVLDRWKPIHGFLDTSDLKHLLAYQKPQTITTPANQTWRILSTPIKKDNQTIGVITVSQYNPDPADSENTDKHLSDIQKLINAKIVINDDSSFTTKNLDVRDINYEISFQVVDRFNKIIAKSNNTNSIDRIPNYLDNSYVGQLLNNQSTQIIKDNLNHEPFLVTTKPLYDSNHLVVGVLVVGHSIAYIYEMLQGFLLAETSIAGLLLFILGFTLYRVVESSLDHIGIHLPSSQFSHLDFNKKKCAIIIDNEEIAIPYATNQYYLCETLFASPKKRWEADELLERFGEVDITNSRKVYDAMNIINKKVSSYINTKLIITKDKTYQLNPTLLSKLS